MAGDATITSIEIETFAWQAKGMATVRVRGGQPKTAYDPSAVATQTGTAIKIMTDAGVVGEYVRGEVGTEGITGTVKMAHAAESVGLDLELHGSGPAQRHVMAALRNTNYYEQVWVHPVVTSTEPPVYNEGYIPGLSAVGKDGCVPVPEGPGLGVVYDWDFITRHSRGTVTVAADT